jgi:hypothetical protein
MTLLCKKITVAQSKDAKTGWSSTNLEKSCKKVYGSKRAVLPMMMMMINGRAWREVCILSHKMAIQKLSVE